MTAVEVQPVSLSSGHSKMDDKKRPATYDQDDSPPLKRQATGANGSSRSHHDTDIPGKDDLEVRLTSQRTCSTLCLKL